MKKFFLGFSYAVHGIVIATTEQRNIKIHLAFAALVVIAGLYLHITPLEWCVVLLTIALVICLEMVNTAIEDLVDLVSPEKKPLAGKVKDIAAGSVLVAAALSVVIGVLIFRKYLFP